MATQKFKWQAAVAKYAYPDTWRSVWQVINSLIPFLFLWYLAYRSLEAGYWLTLLLIIPASGFMARLFIIFHDCGHGSFFPSRTANDIVGFIAVAIVTVALGPTFELFTQFGLLVLIAVDVVILYPVQTATNLMAYEAGYYGARDVFRLGLALLVVLMVYTVAVILPYWHLVGLRISG